MNEYKFTETWFDIAIPGWTELFKRIPKPKRILEVGCYEGRATVWLCENVLKGDQADYDIVDTFGGTLAEAGMVNTAKGLQDSQSFIEDNFRHNISFYPNVNFNIYKGYSQKILPTLIQEEVYDFIYIDASHRADDTFVDSYYALKMLKKGGVIVFDDFAWKDPNDLHPSNSPELGVQVFATMYEKETELLFQGYQVGFIKK